MTKEEAKKRIAEAGKQYLEELNGTVIYKNGDAFTVGYSAFYAGSIDCLRPLDIDMFRWNVDENVSEFEGKTVYSLTLGEIAEQLREMKYTGMLTLFVNRATNGAVYQLGNYGEYKWFELGKLRGFC